MLKDEPIIEFASKSRPWLHRATVALMVYAPLVKLLGAWPASAAVALGLLTLLLGPSRIQIDPKERRLTYLYSPFMPFKQAKHISLAGFSRVYTMASGYGGRTLYLSSIKGEQIILSCFEQNIFKPQQHLADINSLRQQIAATLNIADGGEV
jgi:hypothetical protein